MNTQEALVKVRNELDALAVQKKDVEAKLTSIRVQLEDTMPRAEYRKHRVDQSRYARQVADIEKQMMPLRAELRTLSNASHGEYIKNGHHEARPIVEELVALRQYYQDFAADGTRVSSMRTMAAEFVVKLNPIIKRAVGST